MQKIVQGINEALYLINDNGVVDSAYATCPSTLIGAKVSMIDVTGSFVPEEKKVWRPLKELSVNIDNITVGSELLYNGQKYVVVTGDGFYALMTEYTILSARYKNINDLIYNYRHMTYNGKLLSSTKKIVVGLRIRHSQTLEEYTVNQCMKGGYALVNTNTNVVCPTLHGNLNYGLLLDMIGGGAVKWEYAV